MNTGMPSSSRHTLFRKTDMSQKKPKNRSNVSHLRKRQRKLPPIKSEIWGSARSSHLDQSRDDAGELVQFLDEIRAKAQNEDRQPRVIVQRLQTEQPLLQLASDPPLTITAIAPPG